MVLLCLSLAWGAGLYLGSLLALPPASLLLSLVPLPYLLWPRLCKPALLLMLSLVALLGGGLYYQASLPRDTVHNFTGQVTLRGIVAAEPEVRDQNTRLRLAVAAVQRDGPWQEAAGDVLLYVPHYPAYRYGDVLEAAGELAAPASFDGFNYAGYLARQDVYAVMFAPRLTRVGAGQGNPLRGAIYDLRGRLAGVLAEALPEPEASLAQGILLGLQENIPAPVRSDFARSGTMHILAISGLNLTILTGLLVGLFTALLGRRHYLYVYLTAGVVWGYTLLAGASPSVVRAAIMASVFLLAELTGRQKNAGPALGLAAALMAAANPRVLWDASFQLSVLAMAGLIYLAPPLRTLAQRAGARVGAHPGFLRPVVQAVLESLTVTAAAQLAVGPVLVAYFGQLALAAPLATLLATPVLPLIIVLCLLTTGLGLLSLPLAQLLGTCLWLALAYLYLVAHLGARLPVWEVRLDSSAWLVAYYALLALGLWWSTRRARQRLRLEAAPT